MENRLNGGEEMLCPNCNSNLIDLSDESVCVKCGYSSSRKNKQDALPEKTLDKTKQLQINRLSAQKMYSALQKKFDGKNSFGMSYLLNRGLEPKTIARFGLGWGDNYLPYSLKDKGFSEEEMLLSGIIGKSQKTGKLYNKFFNRVIFPIYDLNNAVIGFGGRVIEPIENAPKYINSKESNIFKKRENLFALNFAKDSKEEYFILCEGYMDVVSMHQAGFTNAVASLGTALTVEQAKLLKSFKDTVYVAYDDDEAGMKATTRAISILQTQGIDVKILSFSPYKDPDELLKACGKDEFLKRLQQSCSAERFLYQKASPEEKCELLVKLLAGKQDR